jgi:S1-C subfamily serine protease
MRTLRGVFVFASLLTLPVLGLGSRLAAEEEAVELYKKCVKSTVFIVSPVKGGGMAMGSGSLIDKDKKYVLTNFHVVDEEDICFVQFPIYQKNGEILTDKQKYLANVPAGLAIKGNVLFRDKSRDLAIVQLDRVPVGATAIPLAKKSTSVGATTWQIGSPGDVAQVFSVTEGKVRGIGSEKFLVGDSSGTNVWEIRARVVTTTNPTNPGDSGGPLFDKRGYQVGVTQSGSRRAQAVNRFIDVEEVRAFLNDKKLTIKELTDEPDPKPEVKKDNPPKTEIGSNPPKKDNGTDTPPKKEDAKASPADERAAAELLRRAALFKEGEDNRPTYIGKLQEIIKKYPATEAAKQAKKMLDGLK